MIKLSINFTPTTALRTAQQTLRSGKTIEEEIPTITTAVLNNTGVADTAKKAVEQAIKQVDEPTLPYAIRMFTNIPKALGYRAEQSGQLLRGMGSVVGEIGQAWKKKPEISSFDPPSILEIVSDGRKTSVDYAFELGQCIELLLAAPFKGLYYGPKYTLEALAGISPKQWLKTAGIMATLSVPTAPIAKVAFELPALEAKHTFALNNSTNNAVRELAEGLSALERPLYHIKDGLNRLGNPHYPYSLRPSSIPRPANSIILSPGLERWQTAAENQYLADQNLRNYKIFWADQIRRNRLNEDWLKETKHHTPAYAVEQLIKTEREITPTPPVLITPVQRNSSPQDYTNYFTRLSSANENTRFEARVTSKKVIVQPIDATINRIGLLNIALPKEKPLK